jgi:hypothetical protein
VLAHAVLVGAVLQVLATVALSLARIEQVQSAAAEGSTVYVGGTAVALAATLLVWRLRARPLVAVPLLLGWPLLVYLTLGSRFSALGIAYHGEFILYHFLSLTCTVTCLWVPWVWRRQPELGRWRWLPLALAGPGAVALVVVHLAAVPALRIPAAPGVGMVGAALLLTAWPVSLALMWRRTRLPRLRIGMALLFLPVAVRVALTGPDGLVGTSVPPERVVVLGIVVCGVAVVAAGAFRPRLDLWARGVVSGVSLLATVFFWALYDRGFGELEDGFDGLIRSFFGFPLPYPAYVSEWKITAMMTAIFLISSTVYSSLVSERTRRIGVPLAIAALAGIGLTSPHLVLMLGAASLLLVDALGREPDDRAPPEPSGDDEVSAVLSETCTRLGLPAPVDVEDGGGRIVLVQGQLDGVGVDVRARRRKGRWAIEVTAGLPPGDTVDVELVPDRSGRGLRPAHPIARSHRVVARERALEELDDRLLDALVGFSGARLRRWAGGAGVELGRDLAALGVDRLEALLRAIVRAAR